MIKYLAKMSALLFGIILGLQIVFYIIYTLMMYYFRYVGAE